MKEPAPITIKIPKKYYPYFLDMVDAYQGSYSFKELENAEALNVEFILFLENEILKGLGTKRLHG